MTAGQARWMLAPPGGPNGPTWSIVELGTGRVVAANIPDETEAQLFLAARELRDALQRYYDLDTLSVPEYVERHDIPDGVDEETHMKHLADAALRKARGEP